MLLLCNPSQVTVFVGLRLLWGCHLQDVYGGKIKVRLQTTQINVKTLVLCRPEKVGMHSIESRYHTMQSQPVSCLICMLPLQNTQ